MAVRALKGQNVSESEGDLEGEKKRSIRIESLSVEYREKTPPLRRVGSHGWLRPLLNTQILQPVSGTR